MAPKKEPPSSPDPNSPKEKQRAQIKRISNEYHARRREKKAQRQEAGRRLAAELARRRAAGEPLSQPATRQTAARRPVANNELKILVITDKKDKKVDLQPGRTRGQTKKINKEKGIDRVNEDGGVQKPSTKKEGSKTKAATNTAVKTKKAAKKQTKTKSNDDESNEEEG